MATVVGGRILTATEKDRRFPILWPWRREEAAALEEVGCPRSIDWRIIEPHREQARRNHQQTLECLAERGGLAPAEMLAVLTNQPWETVAGMYYRGSVKLLLELLAERSKGLAD